MGPLPPGGERDPEGLVRLANARMPSGRYAGQLLMDIPDDYVLWFANRVVPGVSSAEDEQTGIHLAALHAIRFNGLEGMLRSLVDGAEDQQGFPGQTAGNGWGLEDNTDHDLDWLFEMLGE